MKRQLTIAVSEGNIEAVKQHLADGEDMNAKDKWGSTPLHEAVKGGNKEVAELLIAGGADVNAKDGWRKTPLRYAAGRGQFEIVELLVANGAIDGLAEAGKLEKQAKDPAGAFKQKETNRPSQKTNKEIAARMLAVAQDISTEKRDKNLSQTGNNRLAYIFAFNLIILIAGASLYYFLSNRQDEKSPLNIENKDNSATTVNEVFITNGQDESSPLNIENKDNSATIENEVFIANSRARVHFRKKEFSLGLAVIEEALKLSITPELLETKLDILYNLGGYGEAYLVALELIKIDPENASSQYKAGRMAYNAYPRTTRANKALPHYKKYYELKPSPSTKLSVANLLVESGNTTDGFNLFNELVEVDSKNKTIWFNYLNSLFKAEEFNLAEEVFRTALDKDKDNSYLNEYLGQVLEKNGKKDEAVEFYYKCYELDPDPNSVAAKQILRITGKPVSPRLEKKSEVKRKANIDKEQIFIEAKKAEKDGDLVEALNLFEESHGKEKDFRRVAEKLAIQYEKIGASGNAVEYFEEARKYGKANALRATENTISPKELIRYNNSEIYERSKAACVTVKVSKQDGTGGLGSGFFLSRGGYILTNEHVIDESTEVWIKLSNGDQEKADIVDSNDIKDIALLKIEKDHPHYMKLGDSTFVKEGESVVVVGTPLDEKLHTTITAGVISKILENNLKGKQGTNHFLHDVETDPGNSGGPLINSRRRVIGIHTSHSRDKTGFYKEKGFAVKINEAKEMLIRNKVPGF
jgi:S1-C subfamily serine protease/ankyrin repeat protein